MSDLVRILKEKLSIVDLVGKRVELRRAGRNYKGLCPIHGEKTASFTVRPDNGTFRCYGCGAHGDQLTWIAFAEFNTLKPDGETFVEVLKAACKIAGEDYDAYTSKDPRAIEAAKKRRKAESVMDLYVQAAEKAWTKDALARLHADKAQGGAGKPWCTEEVITRWRLGYAPNLEQLKAVGCTPEALKVVGLLRDTNAEGQPLRDPYLFYRDSIIFPFFQRGRVVCLRDRTLGDRGAKYLGMPGDSAAAIAQPDGWNLEALYGIWPGNEENHEAPKEIAVVEGPPDAIALCERGLAAVAMLTSRISPGLVSRIRRLDGALVYVMLDGTSDVNQLRRCEVAAHIGPLTRVCLLPDGLDPDELTPDDLADTKATARPALDEWLMLIEHTPADQREGLMKKFAGFAAEWDKAFPGSVGDRKAAICSALGMDAGEYKAWLERYGGKPKAQALGDFRMDTQYPNQPEPPGKAPAGDDKRPTITNHKMDSSKSTDPDTGEEKTTYRYTALAIDAVRAQVQSALNGFPFRWGPAGEAHPVLFMPDGDGGVRRMQSSKALQTTCMEYATLKFKDKLDSKQTNYAGWDNLFQHFGGSNQVRQYAGIRLKPHAPLIPDLFYAWRPPANYSPDLRWLLEAIDLFYNIRHPWQKAVFAAAIMTPYWGGPPAARPIIVFAADAPGKGKGKASEVVGIPAGGMIEIEADKKGEDQLKERVLSGDGGLKDVIRLDNLKDGLTSPVVESVVTLPEISGKQMYKGEASRPNYFTMLVTANNVKVSPDIARRAFFVQLDDPNISADWEARYRSLLDHKDELIMDCLSVLGTPAPACDLAGFPETFGIWAREVLARVVAHPVLQEKFGALDLMKILQDNQAIRQDVDEDREYALKLEDELVRSVAVWRGFAKLTKKPEPDLKGGFIDGEEKREIFPPKADQEIRITAEEIFKVWKRLFGGKGNKSWLGRKVVGHIKAKRFRWLTQPAARSSSGSEYQVRGNAFTDFLSAFEKGIEGLPDEGYQEQE